MTRFNKVKAVLRDNLPQASEDDIHRMAELVIFAAMGINLRPMFELMEEEESLIKSKLAD